MGRLGLWPRLGQSSLQQWRRRTVQRRRWCCGQSWTLCWRLIPRHSSASQRIPCRSPSRSSAWQQSTLRSPRSACQRIPCRSPHHSGARWRRSPRRTPATVTARPRSTRESQAAEPTSSAALHFGASVLLYVALYLKRISRCSPRPPVLCGSASNRSAGTGRNIGESEARNKSALSCSVFREHPVR